MRKFIRHLILFLLALLVVSTVYTSINHDTHVDKNFHVTSKSSDNQHKGDQIGLPEGLPVTANENSSHIQIKNVPEKTLNVRFWQRFVIMRCSVILLGQLLVQDLLGRTKYLIIRRFQI
jgi:hypothetical protein